MCCNSVGLCAVTTAGYVLLVDVAAAKLAAPACMSPNEPASFDPVVRSLSLGSSYTSEADALSAFARMRLVDEL